MNLNNKQFKVLENNLYQCEDCNCFTTNPGEHDCPPIMKEMVSRRKPEFERIFGKLRKA
jgi:hypothetical protein